MSSSDVREGFRGSVLGGVVCGEWFVGGLGGVVCGGFLKEWFVGGFGGSGLWGVLGGVGVVCGVFGVEVGGGCGCCGDK